MSVSFALFGTLVDAELPADPAAAVGRELRERGVAVPDDWAAAYRERHVDAPAGAAVPEPAHVSRALASRGVDAPGNAARRAVVSAYDPAVATRDGAVDAVAAARRRGPVALLTNCAVPELTGRVFARSALSRDDFDAVVTSAACGWRKPHRRAFETAADRLGVDAASLTHVGSDPDTDGGVRRVDGEFVDVAETPLPELAAAWSEERRTP
ncbi:HAD family hydrolase [Halobaculum sp. P14]|uniref:HAD family hydrolase n=1 Tax=Halobaculum sp. P14 TaxID=3421638 RepID=UPI003EB76258